MGAALWVMRQILGQRAAGQVVQRNALPVCRNAGGQMQVVPDANVERALARYLGLLPQARAGVQIIIHRLLKRLLQLGDGLAFVADQRPDELEPAKQAVVLRTGFDRAVITTELNMIAHRSVESLVG